jgi:hypothetical protein
VYIVFIQNHTEASCFSGQYVGSTHIGNKLECDLGNYSPALRHAQRPLHIFDKNTALYTSDFVLKISQRKRRKSVSQVFRECTLHGLLDFLALSVWYIKQNTRQSIVKVLQKVKQIALGSVKSVMGSYSDHLICIIPYTYVLRSE